MGVERLAEIVGPEGCLDPSRFGIGGATPAAAFAPASADEAVALVRLAGDLGLTCMPWGTGSLVRAGRPPERYDFALSSERLTGTVRHDPEDLTACLRVGTRLADIGAALAPHGQWLPWEREGAGPLTAGGAVATNAAGAPQDGFGLPRDRVLRLRAVTGYGECVSPGAPVVKNVAGYDLQRLYCGSRGTLGFILEATVRLEPLTARVCRRVELAGWDQAAERAEEADRLAPALVSFRLEAAGGALAAFYDLTGPSATLQWAVGLAEGEEAAFDEPGDAACAVRFVVPPSGALTLAAALYRELPSARVIARPLSGVVRVFSDDPSHAARALEIGKEDRSSPPGAELMRRIKQAFDPSGVFPAMEGL